MLTTASTEVSADGSSPACHCCSPGVRPARVAMCPPAEQPATATKVRSPPNWSAFARAHAIAALTSDDLARPAVTGAGSVLHRQAHPTQFGEMSHQHVALQHPAAENPCATRHEDQHRGRPHKVFATPDVEKLTRLVAVGHGGAVDRTPMSTGGPPRRARSEIGQGSAKSLAATMSHSPAVITLAQPALVLRRLSISARAQPAFRRCHEVRQVAQHPTRSGRPSRRPVRDSGRSLAMTTRRHRPR